MFLVQHGHGNGGNVDRAIASGDAQGVIWSPCNYRPASVRREAKKNASATQMLDPQLYVAYAPGVIDPKQLPQYNWYDQTRDRNGRRRMLTPGLIRSIVSAALDFQKVMAELTEITAPAPAIAASTELNRLLAFNTEAAKTWVRDGDDRPLYASVPVLSRLLDDATAQERRAVIAGLAKLDVDGVYLLLEIDPALDQATYEAHLANALLLTNRLSQHKPVRVGYAGLSGWVFRAAGAEATAAGWFQNRRAWSPSNWIERRGGRRSERVALIAPLALLAPGELTTIRDANLGLYQQVVSGVGPLAASLRASPNRASNIVSLENHAAQLFAVCHDLDSRVGNGFVADARRIVADVAPAVQLRDQVALAALTIEGAAADGRPVEWETALRRVAQRLGVQL